MPGVWSVAEDLLTGRLWHDVCGSSNNSLVCGGRTPTSVITDTTEHYSNFIWETDVSLLLARQRHICGGSPTDAVVSLGSIDNNGNFCNTSEIFNGTIWSSITNAPTNTEHSSSAATTSSNMLVWGGRNTSENPINGTFSYNGTAWSLENDLPFAVYEISGSGNISAAITTGENTTTKPPLEWTGSSWSTIAVAPTSLSRAGMSGDNSKAASFQNSYTFDYDGSTWESGGGMVRNINSLKGTGGSDNSISTGGDAEPILTYACVETREFRDTPGAHRAEVGLTVQLPIDSPWIDELAAMFEAWYEESGIKDAEDVVGYELSPRERSNYALVGDSATGEIYALDMNTYTDANFPIKRTRRTQIINKNHVNVIHNRVEVEFEAGVGLNKTSTEDGYDPQATLKWSDDGGNTWSDGKTVSIGQFQQYGTRAVWRRLGKSRNRIYELTMEEPVKTVLVGTYAQIKACKF